MTAARFVALVTCSAAFLGGALGAQAPGIPPRCELQFEGQGARTSLVKLPSGKYNAYQGGGVTYYCAGQDNRLRADSAEYYGDRSVLYLIGNVHYTEPRVTVDSRRMTYFQLEERLLAEGDVVSTLPNGTMLRGPRAEYYRAIPGVRARTRMFADGRPLITLVQVDSAGRRQPPVDVRANRVTMEADSLVYAGGEVLITRPDLRATGDSAFLDSGREFARLMAGPIIQGRAQRPFTLSGTTVDIYSRSRQLERVVSLGDGRAVSNDLDLRADTIDLRVTASKLERAYAWGQSGARAVSPSQLITADSLDVRMPNQRVREVFAVRNAWAQSDPDTTKIRSGERDWLRGDTIVASFDSVPARDTTTRPALVRLVAHGAARSYYQVAVSGAPADQPAINYVRGRTITVSFVERQVSRVAVTERAAGVYLEPGRDEARPAPGVPADSSGRSRRP